MERVWVGALVPLGHARQSAQPQPQAELELINCRVASAISIQCGFRIPSNLCLHTCMDGSVLATGMCECIRRPGSVPITSYTQLNSEGFSAHKCSEILAAAWAKFGGLLQNTLSKLSC